MPVFNVAGQLRACLDSLKHQSFADFEAIVVDDGATDASRAVAVGAIAGDARFRLVACDNGGLSTARNLGLGLARGAFVAFVDGDDQVAPDFLQAMVAALEDTGADWVACGLRWVVPGDDRLRLHSTRHSAPDLDPAGGLSRIDLTDWRAVVDLFPSAWNKLYRRALIEGLRFDAGAIYEDHAFFWQVAARARSILHLARPLYLQTLGRPGQITASGGDEVFRQFEVLERLEAILPHLTGRSHRQEAFRSLAVRLIFERGQVLRDPARRAAYAATARAWTSARGIDWQADSPLPHLGRFGRSLAARPLLSVVVPTNGDPAPLSVTLAGLAHEDLTEVEVLVVLDGTAGTGLKGMLAARPEITLLAVPPDPALDAAGRVAAARNRGCAAASGDYVLFLDAGDAPMPGGLADWAEQLARAGGRNGADFGFAGFVFNHAQGPFHAGTHDGAPFGPWGQPLPPGPLAADAALAVHALPATKLFRRRFVSEHALRFAPHVLQSWAMTLQAATRARRVHRLWSAGVILGDGNACRTFWRAPVAASDLVAAVDQVAASLPGCHPGQRLLTRAIWEKAYFAAPAAQPGPAEAPMSPFLRQARRIWQARALRASGGELFDPYMADPFRRFLTGESDRL